MSNNNINYAEKRDYEKPQRNQGNTMAIGRNDDQGQEPPKKAKGDAARKAIPTGNDREEDKAKERERRAIRARSRSKDKIKGSKPGTPRTRRRGSREREMKGKETPNKDEKVSREDDNDSKLPSGLMNTATNIAMTLMGITATPTTMMVAVKREKANEDERYSGRTQKGLDEEERNNGTMTPNKKTIIDMTTPTSTKRKVGETRTSKPNTNTSGNDKKKPKQQQLIFTPKRITMERKVEENKQEDSEDGHIYTNKDINKKRKDTNETDSKPDKKIQKTEMTPQHLTQTQGKIPRQ